MPDFGEGFNRSDAMLLSAVCSEAAGSNVDSGNPYLDPLLDPSTCSGGLDTSQNCYAAETQGSSPAGTTPSKETAETASGNVLCDMSVADAIKCITGFLTMDARSELVFFGCTVFLLPVF